MEQKNTDLIRKGKAALAADAVTTIVVFVLARVLDFDIPADVVMAFSTLFGLAVIYFTSPDMGDGIQPAS